MYVIVSFVFMGLFFNYLLYLLYYGMFYVCYMYVICMLVNNDVIIPHTTINIYIKK